MQNISFLVIISVLLGCAFFFSELTNFDQSELISTATPDASEETGGVIPSCSDEMSTDDQINCYSLAVQISENLVDEAVDRIMDMETDSDERISFMDIQFNWEESRDSDCSFVHDRIDDPQEAQIKELICLHDENLDRLNQLDSYYCDWFGDVDCVTTSSQGD